MSKEHTYSIWVQMRGVEEQMVGEGRTEEVGTRRIEVGTEVHISRARRRLPSKLRLSPYWSCPFPTGRAPSVGYAVGPGRLEDIA